jgi:16S rRNA (cytosine967-C5)-methyltransferase
MIAPARRASYEILLAVSTGRADLPAAIASRRATLRDDRDRALATDIATGVERWRLALDHLIEFFARRPIDRLDAEVVVILRAGIYQLLHLSRVPASAVVDDAVDLTRRAGKKSAAGFVNAVLRAVSRRRRHLPLPARPADAGDREAALRYLSISLSHPRWLVERWLERYGFDATERWLRFNNEPAPLTLRANRLLTTTDALFDALESAGLRPVRGRFAPDALLLPSGSALAGAPVTPGWFVVQDEASQLVPLLTGTAPGSRVLDACASPGGKTAALAAAMRNRGLLVACDVRDRRMDLLRRTIAACGARAQLVQADLIRPLPFSPAFDDVLVDAPCSGLGTLRRDPDIRWRRREADLEPLAAAQLVMLQHAAEVVAPRGRLIYATCSSEPEENEGVVDAFLATCPGFEALDARDLNPALAPVVDARGRLHTTPDQHGLEAFFGAVFRSTARAGRPSRPRRQRAPHL